MEYSTDGFLPLKKNYYNSTQWKKFSNRWKRSKNNKKIDRNIKLKSETEGSEEMNRIGSDQISWKINECKKRSTWERGRCKICSVALLPVTVTVSLSRSIDCAQLGLISRRRRKKNTQFLHLISFVLFFILEALPCFYVYFILRATIIILFTYVSIVRPFHMPIYM